MATEWLDREAVITVKAYPNPSAKYHETVCVAAITHEEGWVRLYPMQFRSLPAIQRFKKYQRVQLRMMKHPQDSRPESYRPDELSIQLGAVIGTEQKWAKRWEWIGPTVSQSMCEIIRLQKETGKSLGVFRPGRVVDFTIEDGNGEWSARKEAELDQLMLFNENSDRLEKIPFVFRYRYTCDEPGCKGHHQSIIDWELMELYRNVKQTTTDVSQIKEKIRQKYLDELCSSAKDTHFFVGNHSRFPGTFMVLGVFWPPKQAQKSFLA